LILRDSTAANFYDYESKIYDTGKSIIRPGLDYAISCDDALFISGGTSGISDLPLDRCASQMIIFADSGPSIVITVYVWVI
jgi:hypothetical protein